METLSQFIFLEIWRAASQRFFGAEVKFNTRGHNKPYLYRGEVRQYSHELFTILFNRWFCQVSNRWQTWQQRRVERLQLRRRILWQVNNQFEFYSRIRRGRCAFILERRLADWRMLKFSEGCFIPPNAYGEVQGGTAPKRHEWFHPGEIGSVVSCRGYIRRPAISEFSIHVRWQFKPASRGTTIRYKKLLRMQKLHVSCVSR